MLFEYKGLFRKKANSVLQAALKTLIALKQEYMVFLARCPTFFRGSCLYGVKM